MDSDFNRLEEKFSFLCSSPATESLACQSRLPAPGTCFLCPSESHLHFHSEIASLVFCPMSLLSTSGDIVPNVKGSCCQEKIWTCGSLDFGRPLISKFDACKSCSCSEKWKALCCKPKRSRGSATGSRAGSRTPGWLALHAMTCTFFSYGPERKIIPGKENSVCKKLMNKPRSRGQDKPLIALHWGNRNLFSTMAAQ